MPWGAVQCSGCTGSSLAVLGTWHQHRLFCREKRGFPKVPIICCLETARKTQQNGFCMRAPAQQQTRSRGMCAGAGGWDTPSRAVSCTKGRCACGTKPGHSWTPFLIVSFQQAKAAGSGNPLGTLLALSTRAERAPHHQAPPSLPQTPTFSSIGAVITDGLH